jgi:FMN phosphatase YigB (HAD superfamily)
MEQKRTLVFDIDDTLLATIWTYDAAYAAYFQYLFNAIAGRSPSFHDIYDRLFEIDAELSKVWGVKRGRVAESMVTSYRELCKWIEDRWGENLFSPEHEKKIREIGDMPFDYKNHFWLPTVVPVLRELKNRGYILCALSSYDTKLFPEKAKLRNLSEFFGDRIMSVDHKKTAQDFIAVSGWNSPRQGIFYSVGNGESDIRPALEIADNWHGVYIPLRNTSPFFNRAGRNKYFDADPIDHPRVLNINTFRELLDHL